MNWKDDNCGVWVFKVLLVKFLDEFNRKCVVFKIEDDGYG